MEDKKTYYTEDLVKEAIEELEDRIKWIKENEEEDHYEKILHRGLSKRSNRRTRRQIKME